MQIQRQPDKIWYIESEEFMYVEGENWHLLIYGLYDYIPINLFGHLLLTGGASGSDVTAKWTVITS